MPLTPEDVRSKQFTPVRLREGYDVTEVDAFLDQVEVELERLLAENEELRAKLAAVSSESDPQTQHTAVSTQAAATGPSVDAGGSSDSARDRQGDQTGQHGQQGGQGQQGQQDRPAEQPSADSTRTEQRPGFGSDTQSGTGDRQPWAASAQTDQRPDGSAVAAGSSVTPAPAAAAVPAAAEASRHGVGDASTNAVRLLEMATKHADDLVASAKEDADKIIGSARAKADRLDNEARGRADRINGETQAKAEKFERDMADKRTQVLGELEKKKTELERSIDDLASYEREYRSRLKSYFTEQLKTLDGGSMRPEQNRAPVSGDVPAPQHGQFGTSGSEHARGVYEQGQQRQSHY